MVCDICSNFDNVLVSLSEYKNALVAQHYYGMAASIVKSITFIEQCKSSHKLGSIQSCGLLRIKVDVASN